MIALQAVGSGRLQDGGLLPRLHALADDPDAQRPADAAEVLEVEWRSDSIIRVPIAARQPL